MSEQPRRRRIAYPDASEDVAELLSGSRLRKLQSIGSIETFKGKPATTDAWLSRIGDAEGILLGWGIPNAVLERLPKLRVISFTGIGAGNFVSLDIAASRGITVCNTPGYADQTVAEHALALLLSTARDVPRLDATLRDGKWDQSRPGLELHGRRLGLVGFGGIGRQFATLGRALGMEVAAWTRAPSTERAERDGITFMAFEELLSWADVVSLHVALSAETRGLIDARALARMRPDAILLNTARGEVLDEAALIQALSEGRLRAAGLDVFTEEPLPRGHPLLRLDNVVLTPHVAFNTPQANAKIHDIAVDNLVAYFTSVPTNVVAAPT